MALSWLGGGTKPIQGLWARAGEGDLRQFLTSDACRDSSGSTGGAMRKARYWELKKYKEMVDRFELRPRGLADP